MFAELKKPFSDIKMRPKSNAKGLTSDTSKSKFYSICEIRPYLFIAGCMDVSHKKIRELRITHIVDAANISETQRTPNVQYLEVNINDDEREDIKKHFIEAAAFIKKAKESGGKALVYCAAGISRSASICIIYLAIEENMTIKDAYIEIEKVRPIICPNLGFWRQMINYEIEKRGETSVNLLNGMRRPIFYD
uniref:Protein-tyrosine-phosphatase n=1 Tax=Panagrolaimus davidi TaxID=227884 RepID=A0A914Q096_9BILA